MSIESSNSPITHPSSSITHAPSPDDKDKKKEINVEKDKTREISRQVIPAEIKEISPAQELSGRGSTQSEDNQVPKTVLSTIHPQPLVQTEQEFSTEKIKQLKEIFESRYIEEQRWKHNRNYKPDCGQFTHYLLTGKIGQFQESEKQRPSIKQIELGTVDLKKISHKPYTVYAIWAPRTPEGTRATGQYWIFQHYYMHLQDGYYISTNGVGPITVFDSYEKMLRADAFPMRIGTGGQFSTKDGKLTEDISQAVIGESEVGTIY